MQNNYEKGKLSEKIACKFLLENNFSIIQKNWRHGKRGEIDLVVRDNKTSELVFVEVKSRTTSIDEAKELVTKAKQKQIINLAKAFLSSYSKQKTRCRFDVIAIMIKNNKAKLEHIKSAF